MPPVTLVSGAGASPWEARHVGSLLARHSGVQVMARCFEAAHLLAAVRRIRPDVVLVGHDLDALDRDVVAELAAHAGAVIGAYPPGDPNAVRRLIDLGCGRAVPHDLDPMDLAQLAMEMAGRPLRFVDEPATPTGRLVAVWGPTGGPGRSTVALNLAAAAAVMQSALLVDVDPYGGSIAQMLGLPEQPSLISTLRTASSAAMDVDVLAAMCQRVGDLTVLPGIPSGDAWTEVREGSLRAVLKAARESSSLVVADAGFCLEEDEELSYGAAPLRRNLATTVVLGEADLVLAVVRADPVGLRRLLSVIDELSATTKAPVQIVVNRSPATVAGRRKMEMSLALERHTGSAPIAFIPEDPAVTESVWQGRPVVTSHPRSPAARAFHQLAKAGLGALQAVS